MKSVCMHMYKNEKNKKNPKETRLTLLKRASHNWIHVMCMHTTKKQLAGKNYILKYMTYY